MVTGDMTFAFELIAAVLTVLYIGKLLVQKSELDRFYPQPHNPIGSLAMEEK